MGHERQAFTAEVIDHCQNTEPTTVCKRIGYEVEAPIARQSLQSNDERRRSFALLGKTICRRVPKARLRPPRLRTCSLSLR